MVGGFTIFNIENRTYNVNSTKLKKQNTKNKIIFNKIYVSHFWEKF